ncbi:MAG: M23 family metallopeptidase [Mycobacteriales bacterium]
MPTRILPTARVDRTAPTATSAAPETRGRHRGATPPKSRYAAVATTAVLGAGIVALGTAASLQPPDRPASAVASADSPVAGIGLGDGIPNVHGSAAHFDPRIGFSTGRATRSRPAKPISILPIGVAHMTTCFCMRWGVHHDGIDLAAPMLTPIYAAKAGVVKDAGPAEGFGNKVVITHDSRTETLYGHMEKVLVHPGERVRAGQLIALVGSRGNSTGPHLHFEVHLNGTPVDPVPWLERYGIKY